MLSKNALRQLMAQAASAGSLQTVYQTALRGVQEALDIERASLLVFDAAGTMRFVAWSGLSDTYRAAVDGHSPWHSTETAAATILVPDIEQDSSMAALRMIFRGEDIRALAFVPLQFGTRLLGKFMLYYREPHTFTDSEITIAEQIADHVAFAFEHHRVAVELESRLVLERELRLEAETEAALREANERRLSLALAAGGMGAWDWDIASGRVNWSSELERAHGLPPGTFEGTLAAYRRDVYPADADRLSAAIAAALAAPDAPYDIEYRIVRTDGALRWLSSTGRVIVDNRGRPTRMVGICRDVTERKRVEEASAFVASASRVLATTLSLETIVENLARLVVPPLADWCIVQVTDAEGQLHPVEIAHQNAGQTALVWDLLRRWPSRPEHFGSAASVVSTGRSVLLSRISDELLQTRADDPEPIRILQSLGFRSAITVPLQARGRTFGALQLISAESERIYHAADLRFAEEIASWAALAIDNAHLNRQAEEARLAAETSRAQLEALATISDQIAVSLDPDDALRQLAARVVPAFCDYCITYAAADEGLRPLGFAHRDPAREPLVEALARELRVSVDDAVAPSNGVLRMSEPSVLTAPPPILASVQLDAPAGEGRSQLEPRSVMTVPLYARGRTLGAILFATTNDSGRRFGEADLKIAMELASRAALLVDNARLYAEARSAVRSRDDLVAFISHDLRDPLQSISAATATLRLGPQSDDNADSLESIARASTQMRRLVQDLLDVSMLEAGRLPVNREPVDLRDLILEVQTLALPQIKASQSGIETRLAPDLPTLALDRHRILQVLLNLVGNALKFVGPGGLVTIGVDRQDGAVRIWVHDNGTGISSDQLERVFDRFWRSGQGAGAGLGLAVAKGIVEMHGGQIGVTSQPGAGSLFFFTLPIQPEVTVPSVSPPIRESAPSTGSRRCRVLLVDDDRDVIRSLVRLVRSLGHETHVAYSGEEALQVAEACQPQIILMDIGLPGLNGYDTAREMRTRPWGETVTLIAVTGWVREDDRRRALESGFDRHLTKPVDASLLEALLNGTAAAASNSTELAR